MAFVLSYAKQIAEAHAESVIKDCVITVPPFFRHEASAPAAAAPQPQPRRCRHHRRAATLPHWNRSAAAAAAPLSHRRSITELPPPLHRCRCTAAASSLCHAALA